MSTDILHTHVIIAAWLNTSQRIRVGVGMNRVVRKALKSKCFEMVQGPDTTLYKKLILHLARVYKIEQSFSPVVDNRYMYTLIQQ